MNNISKFWKLLQVQSYLDDHYVNMTVRSTLELYDENVNCCMMKM